MATLPASGQAQAEFLKGDIISSFLDRAPAGGLIDGPVLIWSTPVCRFVTRHICTGIFCPNPGTTRDPTTCPVNVP